MGKNLFLISTIFILASCEIASNKRSPTPNDGSDGVILQFFNSEQYAIDSATLRSNLGRFSGMALVTSKESTFQNWSDPILGCLYEADDTVQVSVLRTLDIGDLKLGGPQISSVTLPKNAEHFGFSAMGFIPPGMYTLENTGVSGKLIFQQDFVVPDWGSNIQVASGTNDAQTLPSPQIPEAGMTIHIQKTEALVVTFQAPANTDYVKLRISDGTTNRESNVVCYGAKDQPIVVPPGALNYLRSGSDGSMMSLDFVSARVATDLSGVKESLVMSSIRHLHGAQDAYTETEKITMHFGLLSIE